MREVAAELKALRLYGMVGAWEEIAAQGTQAAVESSSWLIEHLIELRQQSVPLGHIQCPSEWPSDHGNCAVKRHAALRVLGRFVRVRPIWRLRRRFGARVRCCPSAGRQRR